MIRWTGSQEVNKGAAETDGYTKEADTLSDDMGKIKYIYIYEAKNKA